MHERQVGVHPLELGVLVLQLAKLRQVRDCHALELARPLVVRRLAHAVLSACLTDLGVRLNFFEDADYQRVVESEFLHLEARLASEFSTSGGGLRFSSGLKATDSSPEPTGP